MKLFSKKDISKQAEIPERPRYLYDPEPYDQAEERGKKEITKFDSEYIFLLKLIKLVIANGVPPQEVKALSEAYPFVTVDDVGDLASKIWTLATEKYGITREFLLQNLPKNASLKKADKTYDDEWQAQKETQDMLDHAPGYLAYDYGQDKTADDEFKGSEFSGTDDAPNPITDIGPFSSPEDHGAKPQKSPFPNTNWLPADDQNLDQQAPSNVAASRSFSKKANPDSRYWIAPDGAEFPVSGIHPVWIKNNFETLKKYGIDPIGKTLGELHDEMINSGWVRISNEPADSGFIIQVKNWRNPPSFLDNFIAKNFTDGDRIVLASDDQNYLTITDPFPSLQKAINKTIRRGSAKQAAVNGDITNKILQLIHNNGEVTYNFASGDMAGTPNYSVSIYPDREQVGEGVDFDRLESFLDANEDLLMDANNSVGAWSNGGKIYLDVVVTLPDMNKAIELAKQHNQIAIWDLQNNREISTGGTGNGNAHAFSKKSLIKTAEESLLCQEDQNEIAAASSPAYVIAVNNYAEAVKRGHDKDRSFEYAIESVQNLEKIDPKKLIEFINNYL